MESLSNAAKRKKRKTRKYLDEIRKRSRRTGQMLFEKDDNQHGEIYTKNVQQCMITNNRLTLRMLPKAVRSKTITRPALIELEHKPSMSLDELVTGKAINFLNGTKVPLSDFGNNELFKNKRRISDNCVLDSFPSAKENVVQNTDESKENFELFSSMDELVNKSPDSIGTQSASTATSTSTQSLQDDNGYNLYEEFMSEVPACLQQNAKLIQEDVMKKTKMLLQNLFIESCYQECGDNILKCIKNDPGKNMYVTSREVVHDPMDYIRLGHKQQSQLHKLRGSILGSGSSPPTSPSDAPLSVVIPDTPDYTYYPHRLN